MKQRMQGIVIGILVTVLLLGTVTVYAAAQLSLAGQVFSDLRFFVDGTEFDVYWDESTGSVHLSSPESPNETPFVPPSVPELGANFARTVPPFDVSHSGNRNDVRVRDEVRMGGVYYEDVITFMAIRWYRLILHSLHNLGGSYTTLTGVIGRVDGTGQYDGVFRFFGDGRQIQEVRVRALDLPTPININVAGINNLRIEFEPSFPAGGQSTFAFYALSATIR